MQTRFASAIFGLALAAVPALALAQDDRRVPQNQMELQLSFAPVVREIVPAVVNVVATGLTNSAANPFDNDSLLGQLFADRFRDPRRHSRESIGSGVFVDPSGVVLTNSHVTNGASDIRIATQDGREYAVDLVLDDPATDLAVLRVREPGGRTFPSATFGDSDSLQVGDIVLAVGNPFGVGQTVTSGIVSALARADVDTSELGSFIQTDAAINPGNSGGALVDLNGDLIGINTSIFTQTGGSVGIGFAIPVNMARVVAEAGMAGAPLQRPWLGARLEAISGLDADRLGLASVAGALVAELVPDGPAARAGLLPGDVVLALNGATIDSPSSFTFRLATQSAGGSAIIAFARGAELVETNLALEAPPGIESVDQLTVAGDSRFAGATVVELNAAFAERGGLPLDLTGVLVVRVESRSKAARIGLRAGDVLITVQGLPVPTTDAFAEIVEQDARNWLLEYFRDGRFVRSVVGG